MKPGRIILPLSPVNYLLFHAEGIMKSDANAMELNLLKYLPFCTIGCTGRKVLF